MWTTRVFSIIGECQQLYSYLAQCCSSFGPGEGKTRFRSQVSPIWRERGPHQGVVSQDMSHPNTKILDSFVLSQTKRLQPLCTQCPAIPQFAKIRPNSNFSLVCATWSNSLCSIWKSINCGRTEIWLLQIEAQPKKSCCCGSCSLCCCFCYCQTPG